MMKIMKKKVSPTNKMGKEKNQKKDKIKHSKPWLIFMLSTSPRISEWITKKFALSAWNRNAQCFVKVFAKDRFTTYAGKIIRKERIRW